MFEPSEPLLESTAGSDPFALFGRWFDAAAAHQPDPEAMAVASADRQGRPSVRMVLLKSWDEDGFVFFTNRDSRKGRELTDNPFAALLFHWEPTARQIRIEGAVEPTSDAVSDAYFATRPRGSQVGAHASHQSRAVADRAALEAQVARAEDQLAGGPVPRPPWWGGLRVIPDRIEFWQHRQNRLHDRLQFRRRDGGWQIDRLQP
jgi:pyridoxamine 5'-phosphate oxidase